MSDKKITKELVLSVLDKVNEKDFLRVIDEIDKAIEEDEKARAAFRNFNLATGTVKAYKDVESRMRVCAAIKANKLKEFYDLFTERVRTFCGMSVIRKKRDGEEK